jgi:hypothetical protein
MKRGRKFSLYTKFHLNLFTCYIIMENFEVLLDALI